MILDFLANGATYFALGGPFERALRYISETDFTRVGAGRYELDGDRVFALVSEYESMPVEQGTWEAHRRHIDVQYVASGEEQVGYANIASLTVMPYDEDRDLLRASGDGERLLLRPDRFVILFPQDVHMPGLAVTTPAPVRKVVVKIRIAIGART
jgi:YhcH/YjgK/YiaL family protein